MNKEQRMTSHRNFWMSGSRLVMLAFAVSGVLMWCAAPRSGPIPWSNELKTKIVIKDLLVALTHFKTEYGRYPVQANETKILRSAGVLLVSLMAEHPLSNPRNIKFIDLPFTKEIGGGIIDHAGGADRPPKPEDWELRDIWGEQFYVLIDSNEDGQIPNPEAGWKPRWFSRYVPTPTLQTHVAIFSSGPDRDSKTWEDNICSWR